MFPSFFLTKNQICFAKKKIQKKTEESQGNEVFVFLQSKKTKTFEKNFLCEAEVFRTQSQKTPIFTCKDFEKIKHQRCFEKNAVFLLANFFASTLAKKDAMETEFSFFCFAKKKHRNRFDILQHRGCFDYPNLSESVTKLNIVNSILHKNELLV